jgi:hypothetical protein
MENKDTQLHPRQIQPTKEGYASLYEQLEFGRFHSVKSGAAPCLYQEIVATQGQSEFTLVNGTFTVGDHSLQVFVNGQLMRVGSDNDYIEVNSRTIRFHFGLDEGDVVTFRVNGGTSGPLLHENHIAAKDQTVFTLNGSYETGNNSLLVFVSGAYQTKDVDYVETDSKTVTMLEPLEEGDLVTFRVEGLPTITSKYQNTMRIRRFDNSGRLLREETTGDIHIIKEYEYDADGKPFRMIIRDSGYIVTKTYEWDGDINTAIHEEVQEGI